MFYHLTRYHIVVEEEVFAMTRGKRVAPVSIRPNPRAAAARAAAMARARSVRGSVRGSREEPQSQSKTRPRRRGRFLVQLVVSAMVLLCVVAAKITMPDITAKYSGEVLRLMGEETDFVAAFSAAGRAIGGEAAGEAIEELCVAVFGSDAVEISATVDRTDAVYSADTIPARVEMLQQVLGFDYTCPVDGTLSSSFGYRDHPVAEQERFHYGLDLSAEEGAVIRAFADGTVLAVAESTELGKYVEVVHANGYTTLYAHCSRINASAGQSVKAGDPIAEVGSTGDATGNHLHFELCCDGTYLNPIYYVF